MANQPPNQPQNQPQNQQQQPQQQRQPQQQQPQQQQRRQPSGGGGRQPPRGGGGGGLPSGDILKVAGAIAVLGVVLGLTPLIYGIVAGNQVLYGTEDELDAVDERFENAPDEQKDEIQEQESAQTQQFLVRQIAGGSSATPQSIVPTPGLAPFMAIFVSGLIGAIVGIQMSGSQRDILLTAGVGALAGAFLFVLLSTFLATLGWESAGEGSNATEASVEFVALLLNSIGIGVLAAIGSAGTAYFTDQLGE